MCRSIQAHTMGEKWIRWQLTKSQLPTVQHSVRAQEPGKGSKSSLGKSMTRGMCGRHEAGMWCESKGKAMDKLLPWSEKMREKRGIRQGHTGHTVLLISQNSSKVVRIGSERKKQQTQHMVCREEIGREWAQSCLPSGEGTMVFICQGPRVRS